jgi:hypothetical protein
VRIWTVGELEGSLLSDVKSFTSFDSAYRFVSQTLVGERDGWVLGKMTENWCYWYDQDEPDCQVFLQENELEGE